jgi:predicted helicase
MRYALTETFDLSRVVDLHGSKKKREESPDGTVDENVFDIQQGVSISIFVKSHEVHEHKVQHTDVWGNREHKYSRLTLSKERSMHFTQIACAAPSYFFVPKDFSVSAEYRIFLALPEMFPVGTSAVQTKRDALFVDVDKDALATRMSDVIGRRVTGEIASRYPLEDSSGWSANCLRDATFSRSSIRPYLYRPFDQRFIYYDDALLGRSRITVFRHLLKPNIALATLRQTVDDGFRHVFCSAWLCDINLTIGHHVSDQVFPLYLYSNQDSLKISTSRLINIKQSLPRELSAILGVQWLDDGKGDLRRSIGPEDFFNYVYAVLHCPSYRRRYAEFLKIEFPRVPLPGDLKLFRALTQLGGELVALHLLESPKLAQPITEFVDARHSEVEKISWSRDTVWLDKALTIGFKGVREDVWNFQIGGYQVCEKWLKDRKGRTLSDDDIAH